MVKSAMPKNLREGEKVSRAATHDEIKTTIQKAIDLLHIQPERKDSFSPLASEVGVTSSTLYGAYRGDHGLGPGSLQSIRQFIQRKASNGHADSEIIPLRRIPLVSWAQAGQAVDFEELPVSWQKMVPTDVADPKAFAVAIVGNSMEPRHHEGDVATLTPSEPLRQNDKVIARLKDQGVVFKLYSRSGNTVRFSSYNPAYAPFEEPVENIVWIYPVYSVLEIVYK